MQALEFLALVLVNLALTVYLVEKGTKFWKEKRRLKRLVNQHPEMKGCIQMRTASLCLRAMIRSRCSCWRTISPVLMSPSTSQKRIWKRTESIGAGMER